MVQTMKMTFSKKKRKKKSVSQDFAELLFIFLHCIPNSPNYFISQWVIDQLLISEIMKKKTIANSYEGLQNKYRINT